MPSLPPIRSATPSTPGSKPEISEREAHNLIGKLHLMKRQVDKERDAFRAEIAALKQQNKQLQDGRLQFERAVNSQLTNQLSAFHKSVTDAETVKSVLASETAKIQALQKHLHDNQLLVSRLQSEIAAGQAKSQQEIFSLQTVHARTLSEKEDELDTLQDQVAALKRVLDDHEKTAACSLAAAAGDLGVAKKEFGEELRKREREISDLQETVRVRDRIIFEKETEKDRCVTEMGSEISSLTRKVENLELKLVAKDAAAAESPEHLEYLELKRLLPLREQTLLSVSSQLAELERQHAQSEMRHGQDVETMKETMEKSATALHTEMQCQAERFQLELDSKEEATRAVHRFLDENIKLLASERERFAVEVDRHGRELKALEEGRSLLVEENRMLQQRQEVSGKEVSREIRQYEVKFTQLQNQLDVANDKFRAIMELKDTKIAELMEIARQAETDLTSVQQEYRDREKQWDDRVVQKEQGYDRLLGTLKQVERQVDIERARVEEERSKAALQHKEGLKRERALASKIEDLHSEIAGMVQIREQKRMEVSEFQTCLMRRLTAIYGEFDDERLAFATMRQELETVISNEQAHSAELEEELRETSLKLTKTKDDYDLLSSSTDLERKKFEKTILNLQIDKKQLADTLIEKTREMTVEIQRLTQVITKLESEAEKMKYRIASLEEAEYAIADLRRKLEDAMTSVENMKKQLRQKDFQMDDVKKETAELLYAKEVAYKKLLETFSTTQQDAENDKQLHRLEIARLDEKFRDKEREVKTMRNDFLTKLDCEQAQNKQLLVDTRIELETWKSAAAKYKDLSATSEATLEQEKENFMRVLKELSERNHSIESENMYIQTKLENTEKHYNSQLAEVTESLKSQLADVSARNRRIEEELRNFDVFHDSEMKRLAEELNTGVLVSSLRKEIAELQLMAKTKGQSLHVVYEENRVLRKELEQRQRDKENMTKEMNNRLRSEELKYKRMIFENEELKLLLIDEVKKAEVTCRILEEQLQELPKPFEEQVAESQRRTLALADAVAKMAKENADLESKLSEVTRKAEAHEAELAHKIRIAEHVFLELHNTDLH